MRDYVARFWQQVDKTDGCWLWTGYTNPEGYGEAYDGAVVAAHRWSWSMVNGPIPAGMVIRHTCDVRNCVNPDHLLIGTHADNIADKVARNRQAKGERNGRSRLTLDQVREIRQRGDAGESVSALALEFGVTRRAIEYIVQRVNWRWAA